MPGRRGGVVDDLAAVTADRREQRERATPRPQPCRRWPRRDSRGSALPASTAATPASTGIRHVQLLGEPRHRERGARALGASRVGGDHAVGEPAAELVVGGLVRSRARAGCRARRAPRTCAPRPPAATQPRRLGDGARDQHRARPGAHAEPVAEPERDRVRTRQRRRELDAGEVLRAVDAQHGRRVEQAARLRRRPRRTPTRRPSTRTRPPRDPAAARARRARRSSASAARAAITSETRSFVGAASAPIAWTTMWLPSSTSPSSRARSRTSVELPPCTRKRASLASRRGSAVASSGARQRRLGQPRAAARLA